MEKTLASLEACFEMSANASIIGSSCLYLQHYFLESSRIPIPEKAREQLVMVVKHLAGQPRF